MQARKLLFIGVGSLAGLIVIAAFIIIVAFLGMFRGGRGQNFVRPPEGQQAISPVADIALYSQVRGNSSFLYRKDPATGTNVLSPFRRAVGKIPILARSGLPIYPLPASPLWSKHPQR